MGKKGFKFELECPSNRDGCKYQPECPLWSIHHEVPRSAGKLAVAEAMADDRIDEAHIIRSFIEHWSNKVRVGRCIHDLLDTMPKPLPSLDEMQRRLET